MKKSKLLKQIAELKKEKNDALILLKVAEDNASRELGHRETAECQIHELWRVACKPVEELTLTMNRLGFGDYRSLRTRLLDNIKANGIPLERDAGGDE